MYIVLGIFDIPLFGKHGLLLVRKKGLLGIKPYKGEGVENEE